MSEYIKKEDALKAVSDMAYENSATIRELLTELPTYSFPDSAENKGDTVSRVAYEQIMWERDTAIQQLKDLGYGLGEKPKDNKDDFISRQAVDRLVWQYLRRGTDENIAFYEHFLDLPSADVRENIHGHWGRLTRVEGVYSIDGVKTWGIKCQCDKCTFTTIVIEGFGFYDHCPRCGSRNEVEADMREPKGEKGTE